MPSSAPRPHVAWHVSLTRLPRGCTAEKEAPVFPERGCSSGGRGPGAGVSAKRTLALYVPRAPPFHRCEEDGSKEDVPQAGLGHVIPCQSSGSKVTVSLLVYTGVAEDTDVTCRPPLAAR